MLSEMFFAWLWLLKKRANTKLLFHFLESILIAVRTLSRKRSKKLHKMQRVVKFSPRPSLPWTKSSQPSEVISKAPLIRGPKQHRIFHTSWFTGTWGPVGPHDQPGAQLIQGRLLSTPAAGF